MVCVSEEPMVKYQSTPMSPYCIVRKGSTEPRMGACERSAFVSSVSIPVLIKLE